MIFSDANPVQFWCTGQDTFNETEPEGVFRTCFCQPFNSDDEITTQFQDSTGKNLSLLVIDSDNNTRYEVSFSEVYPGFYQNQFTPLSQSIDGQIQLLIVNSGSVLQKINDPSFDTGSGWSNDGGPTTAWVISGGSAEVELTESFPNNSSQNLESSFSDTINFSIVRIIGRFTRVGGSPSGVLRIIFSKDGVALEELNKDIDFSVSLLGGAIQNFDEEFIVSSSIDKVKIVAFVESTGSSDDVTVTINSFSILETSSDYLLAKSDCILIKENHKETVLINYSNNRIFTGLSSSVGTPDPEFNLRIPGCFYHERFPTQSEVIQLSSGRNIQLSSELTAQKLLEIGIVPYYLHKKIKLALMFQIVSIDSKEWVMTESYDITQSNRRSALKQAKVWLTQKDSTVRNIL